MEGGASPLCNQLRQPPRESGDAGGSRATGWDIGVKRLGRAQRGGGAAGDRTGWQEEPPSLKAETDKASWPPGDRGCVCHQEEACGSLG